mgnify:CR=1 FL=1
MLPKRGKKKLEGGEFLFFFLTCRYTSPMTKKKRTLGFKKIGSFFLLFGKLFFFFFQQIKFTPKRILFFFLVGDFYYAISFKLRHVFWKYEPYLAVSNTSFLCA